MHWIYNIILSIILLFFTFFFCIIIYIIIICNYRLLINQQIEHGLKQQKSTKSWVSTRQNMAKNAVKPALNGAIFLGSAKAILPRVDDHRERFDLRGQICLCLLPAVVYHHLCLRHYSETAHRGMSGVGSCRIPRRVMVSWGLYAKVSRQAHPCQEARFTYPLAC